VASEISKPASDFEVVMVYEDLATGLRTKQLFEYLVREHSQLFRFTCHLWRFEILQIPEQRNAAVDEAARADMIIIAAHAGRELSRTIKEWIALWICKKEAASALVTLLEVSGSQSHGTGPIRSYLREVAKKGQMSFFCQEVHSPNESVKFPVEIIQEHVIKLSSVQQRVVTEPVPAQQRRIDE
jgi:hypothetical protein